MFYEIDHLWAGKQHSNRPKHAMHLILGAGPAGMFCAHELIKHGIVPVLLEKEKMVGGLAATHVFKGCRYEVGPHILYTKDQYIIDIFKSYLGDECIKKKWSVAQYIEGHFFKFPNSAWDMTVKLGPFRMLHYFASYLKYRGRAYQNYEELIYSRVGKKLAHFNVINYSKKMWGVNLNELESEWIKPRLDRLSLIDILKNTIAPKNREYYYPRNGAGQLYESMESGMNIHKEEFPVKIVHDKKKIKAVQTNIDKYKISTLYSSLGLQELISLFSPSAPESVVKASKNLKYRSQIYVVLHLNVHRLLNYQWIYFNETRIPFCRIHEPKNFTDKGYRSDSTVIVAEYFCFFGDRLWERRNDELFQLTSQNLGAIGIFDAHLIKGFKVLRKKNAYPLMVKDRQKNLSVIFDYLHGFNNIHSFGRHGLHTFDNQDTAGRSAIDAVHKSFGK